MNKTYIYCDVLPANYKNPYLYICDFEVKEGDIVIIPIRGDNIEKVGLVLSVNEYTKENAPWEVEKTKHILRPYKDNESEELKEQKISIDKEKSIRFMSSDRNEKLKLKEKIFNDLLSEKIINESKTYIDKITEHILEKSIEINDDNIQELSKNFILSSDKKIIRDYKNINNKYRGIVYIPSGIETIEDNVFLRKKIEIFYFPKELKNIGTYTLYDKNIKKIYVDKENLNFTSDDKSFCSIINGKKKLELVFDSIGEEYTVPGDISIIGTNAFSNNKTLKKIILSDGVEEFYEDSLNDNIKEVFISKTVKKFYTKIYEDERDNKIKTSYYIDEENPYLFKDEDSIYEVLEDNTYKLILNTYDGKGEVLILDNTSIIGKSCFAKTNNINNLNLPNSIKEIEDYAFYSSNIKKINISDGCLKLGHLTFGECNNLKKVTIPSNLYFLKSTFYCCNELEEINTNDNSKKYKLIYDKNDQRNIIESSPNNKDKYIYNNIDDYNNLDYNNIDETNIFRKFVSTCIKTIKEDSFYREEYKNHKAIYDEDRKVLTVSISFEQKDDSIELVNERVECCERLKENDKVNIEIKDDILEFRNIDGYSIGTTSYLYHLLVKYGRFINISSGLVESITPKSSRNSNAKYAIGLIKFEISEADNSHLSENELEIIKMFNYKELENSYIFTHYIGDQSINKVTIPGTFKGKQVILGIDLFAADLWNDHFINIKELTFGKGIKEIGPSVLFNCDSFEKITLPNSIEYISPDVFTNKDGTCRDIYLNKETIYVVEKGSYAENFLKNYKITNYDFNRFRIINEDSEESINELEKMSVYDINNNSGILTAMFKEWYKKEDFKNKEVTLPTISNNDKITCFDIKNIPNCIEKIIIPKEITTLKGLQYQYLFSGNGEKLNSIEINSENPNYYSDGLSIFTKDRKKLIRFMSFTSTNYSIPEGTEEISKYAFGGMENITTLTLPTTLKFIDDNAFYECDKLEEINGLEYVQTIEKNVFIDKYNNTIPFYNKSDIIIIGNTIIKYNALNQETITIKEGIKEISKNAFSSINKDDQVREIILPQSIEILGQSVFCNRTKLRKINIPEGIKEIPKNLFSLCESLEYLYIPASVEKIELSAFPGYIDEYNYRSRCNSSLNYIEINPNNKNYSSSDGMLFNKDKTELLTIFNFKEKVLRIPEGITSIADNLMNENEFIEELILPESLINIGASAFNECKKLKKVILPKNLETISDNAFSGCIKLKEVIWPQNLKTIGSYAFAATGFTKLELPNTIEHIGKQAFAEINVKSVVLPKSVRTLEWGVFSGIEDITVYDSVDPNAKDCVEEIDTCNGNANSLVGYIGIGPAWAMWECAANHKWSNYTITVKSAQTDEIKYKVWMGADSSQRDYYCFLSSAWGYNATFAFSYLDEFFPKIRGASHKKKVCELRLEYPYELSEEKKKMYENYLKESS